MTTEQLDAEAAAGRKAIEDAEDAEWGTCRHCNKPPADCDGVTGHNTQATVRVTAPTVRRAGAPRGAR